MRLIPISLALSAICSAAPTTLVLPSWTNESRNLVAEDEWLPGAGLLTVEAEDPVRDATDVGPPTSSEMTEQTRANEIPDGFLDAYFANRPTSYLVDPQGLLGPSATRDRLNFLNYHSEDSQIDFHVFLFTAEQEIPGEVREEEISERVFGEGKPSLTLFYYLGAPERSEIFLSPSLTDSVSDAERRRILQSSILVAQEKSDVVSQLEAFCVQTSIRIYWIEKAAGLIEGETVVGNATSGEVVPLAKTSRTDAFGRMFDVFWWNWGAIVTVSSAGLMIALASWWVASRRAKHRFPEFEVAARLGGAHAAGIGAVIGFGSTTQSPSTQHSGVPDYFGGI